MPDLNFDILPKRRKRNRKRDTYPRAVEKRQLQNIVKRKLVFDSVTFGAPFSQGVVSISNGEALTINNTITDPNGALWLMVPEWSLFVDAISDSNEYPNGSFFSSSSAASDRQDPDNYGIVSNIKQKTSTDDVIKWSIRFTNNTGADVKLGCKLGMRFIINTNSTTT